MCWLDSCTYLVPRTALFHRNIKMPAPCFYSSVCPVRLGTKNRAKVIQVRLALGQSVGPGQITGQKRPERRPDLGRQPLPCELLWPQGPPHVALSTFATTQFIPTVSHSITERQLRLAASRKTQWTPVALFIRSCSSPAACRIPRDTVGRS